MGVLLCAGEHGFIIFAGGSRPWKPRKIKIVHRLLPTQEQIDEESRRIRRLRILVRLTLETIAEGGLSAEEAAGMIAATRRVALEMFPGKERAFDLIYRPQFQRLMHAVYRLQ